MNKTDFNIFVIAGKRMETLPGISPLSLAESSFPKPLQNQMQALSIQEASLIKSVKNICKI